MKTRAALTPVLLTRLLIGLIVLAPALLVAQESGIPAGYEVVLDGLDNPSGLAIQPSTGAVFVSESGAGRVIRLAEGKAVEVVTGFPTENYGESPSYRIGPLGLGFLASDLLLVGEGGKKDGEDALHLFEIKVNNDTPVDAAKPKTSLRLPAEGERPGEGNFYAVAVSSRGVYLTANGDDALGWVAKAERNGRILGAFQRHIATKKHTNVDAPAAITLSPAGELLVGQMGEIKTPGDSRLTFYAEDGTLLADHETELHDIVAAAYGPNGNLYVADFSWANPDQGGLFQVTVSGRGRQATLKTSRIASLPKPTAMAFAPDGSLYVTVYGEGGDQPTGKLLRREPGL